MAVKLQRDLAHYLTRPLGMEAVMRVRATKAQQQQKKKVEKLMDERVDRCLLTDVNFTFQSSF